VIADEVNYCPRCGNSLIEGIRYGRIRKVCPQCDWIYFADPKVAAAVLVEKNGKVLLVRRANDPAKGLWTLPAGFVDAGEDPARAAERECLEETGLKVEVKRLIEVMAGQEHPRGANITIFYQAEIIGGEEKPSDDVDCVAYFGRDELPPLAFESTKRIIKIDV